MTAILVFDYGYIEINPIANKVMEISGRLGFVLFGLISTGVGIFFLTLFYYVMQNFKTKKFYYLLYYGLTLAVLLNLAPVVNNIWQVIK